MQNERSESEINIEWDGPYTHGEFGKISDEGKDYGVYQVYGSHAVYGSNTLLYIGMAAEQTFGVRIGQEGWSEDEDPDNLQIYVGRLIGPSPPDDEVWKREISQAEQLLIYAHAPAYNSRSIATPPRQDDLQGVRVFNWKKYRALNPEVSGARWARGGRRTEGSTHYKWKREQ